MVPSVDARVGDKTVFTLLTYLSTLQVMKSVSVPLFGLNEYCCYLN